ncbi:hypothetical protein LOTGIDRAFT_156443 [Lottia gigantea]|uniref:Methyltransferase small domain-containing protein n=1 Tax=Lottia gigantea TaxID=225164 RepID=V4B955_LOTGI|nr:hypothetical protein LOTGIDRAFT_156443 [Lottia gigantea]ESP03846.1 hypothetical protein LOTGIDRAFT_156443 [Lottia gigantea]
MTEEENKVLSDIHVSTHYEEVNGANSKKRVVSRFVFTLPISEEIDSDHDENLKDHNLETVLADVGLQIWSGCLLLCDYIIYNNTEFINKTILDLGAGCGLSSIVAAMFASTVYCTDYSDDILDLARENIELNNHLIPDLDNIIEIRKLDWMNWGCVKKENDLSVKEASEVEVFIAAEVIYDIDLTTALFNTITYLLDSSSKTVYISLEKRCNFSVNDLTVVTPAYSHFLECLEILQSNLQSADCRLEYNRVSCDFPQYFKYSRLKELELWKITSKKRYPKR